MPGVSNPCGSPGLSPTQAAGLAWAAGIDPRVVSFDIAEYNPFVEDQRSGRMVATLFYWFALGVSQRLLKL